jgi:hypothetical protein
LHGGVDALQLERSFCADAGENVVSAGSLVAQVSPRSQGWTTAGQFAKRGEWHLLSVANGLPVESIATPVWFVQHGASVFSRMDATSDPWTNRARRLLVGWEKKADNYLAFVHLQFGYITLKQSKVLE